MYGSTTKVQIMTLAGFSLTPYLESFTSTFGQGTPVFPRISSKLHCGTPTFSKRCLWDSYFQNPSEDPAWVDLDPFYAEVKFGHIGFCMGKSENHLFFGNYCSLGSQSCLKHLAK